MIKIKPNPEFSADVEITVPGQDKTEKINLTFKYMTRPEYISFFESHKESDIKDVFSDFVLGWAGLDAEYNPKNVAQFLENYPVAGIEIIRAYRDLLLESRIKN